MAASICTKAGEGAVQALHHARAAFEARIWPDAVRHYHAYLQHEPGDLPATIMLGHALKEAGRIQDAILAYAAARALPDGMLQLGHIAKNNGKIMLGLQCFEALLRDPDWAEEAAAEYTALSLYHMRPKPDGERQAARTKAALESGAPIIPQGPEQPLMLDLPAVAHPLCITLEAAGGPPAVHLDQGRGWLPRDEWRPLRTQGPARLVVMDPLVTRRIRIAAAPGLRLHLAHATPQISILPARPGMAMPQESQEYRRVLEDARPGFSLRHQGRAPLAAIAIRRTGEALPPQGDWVVTLAEGHRLHPDAVALFSDAIAQAPDAEAFYTDEALHDDQGAETGLLCKPAINPVLLRELDYIGQAVLHRREVAALPLSALPPAGIYHIPFPAFSRHEADAPATLPAPAMPAVDPGLEVTVVIPSRDQSSMLERCLEGLLHGTAHRALRIMVVDNGTTEPAALRLLRRHAATGAISHIAAPGPFNFARLVNLGALGAKGPVLLLNNDIEVIEPGWLTEMLACLALPGTGVVGARLLYPDRSLQHAGVMIGLNGACRHWYAGASAEAGGIQGRLRHRQNLSAVTGACMLAAQPCWAALGGFDARHFAVAYNDVDFCLRAGAGGFATVWTPHATLIHHESASRSPDDAPGEWPRHRAELAAFQARWNSLSVEDPAFSPWFSRHEGEPVARRWPTGMQPRGGGAVTRQDTQSSAKE
ncbi:glycosyltransferase [Rhodovarius sp.]|uniref:glycosyltransferase n=1 Tax=Rhodovarius sp. TaxID=2972673 RepID=UPI00333F93E0